MKALRRWWWLGLLAVPLVLGLARLRFDVDVLNLLPGDLPAVRGLKLHQEYFADEGELIITVKAPDPDSAEAAAEQLAVALRAATNRVERVMWRPPWLDHPEDTADFLAWLWLNQPPAAWRELTERLSPEHLPAHLDAARERLGTSLSPIELARLGFDPLGLTSFPEGLDAVGGGGLSGAEDRFASADGCFRLVLVKPHADRTGFLQASVWLEEVQGTVDRCAGSPGWPGDVRVAYTGKPAFLAEAAGGMQRDMQSSVLGTLAVIAALFWLAHRRWGPLLGLLAMLQVVLLLTLALGGLFHGTINLVSFGFAAILLGLSVDYGLVLYQDLAAAGAPAVVEVRRRNARAISGSAVTTAAAFALLNFGGLPGLGQLGTLVAMGVLVAAGTMMYGFLPLAARGCAVRRPASREFEACGGPLPLSNLSGRAASGRGWPHSRMWALAPTGVLLLVGGWLVLTRWPPVDHGTQSLSPRHSQAEPALREISRQFGRGEEPLLVLVSGRDEAAVHRRLEALATRLQTAQAAAAIASFELPLALWPNPDWQRANLPQAQALAGQREAVRAALRVAGFAAEGGALADRVFARWAAATDPTGVIWPADASSRWLTERVAARTPEGWLALGTVQPAPDLAPGTLPADMDGVLVCGWQLLGEELLGRVEARMTWLIAGVGGALLGCLWLTFGRWTDVALAVVALAFGCGLLLATMAALGWSWNLMNLTALPLLLGAGVDYAIHVQLSLRRHGNDLAAVRRTTGRALLLCAGTTIAAFGSLAFSSNAGLASLGQVCAVGVAAALVSALYLLPAWRYAAQGNSIDLHGDRNTDSPRGRRRVPKPERL